MLRDVRMELLPDRRCIAEWNSGGFTVFRGSTMVCAGGDDLPSTCFVSIGMSVHASFMSNTMIYRPSHLPCQKHYGSRQKLKETWITLH